MAGEPAAPRPEAAPKAPARRAPPAPRAVIIEMHDVMRQVERDLSSLEDEEMRRELRQPLVVKAPVDDLLAGEQGGELEADHVLGLDSGIVGRRSRLDLADDGPAGLVQLVGLGELVLLVPARAVHQQVHVGTVGSLGIAEYPE